jgi:hypothetical protein
MLRVFLTRPARRLSRSRRVHILIRLLVIVAVLTVGEGVGLCAIAYRAASAKAYADSGNVSVNMPTGTLTSTINYRSVDAGSIESVDSESVSVVPTAPAASLTGSGSGSRCAAAVCFISTPQMAFNPDVMRGLALLGFIVILWRLIMRIKVYYSRHKAHGARLQPSTRPGRDYGSASREKEFSNLKGDPPVSI